MFRLESSTRMILYLLNFAFCRKISCAKSHNVLFFLQDHSCYFHVLETYWQYQLLAYWWLLAYFGATFFMGFLKFLQPTVVYLHLFIRNVMFSRFLHIKRALDFAHASGNLDEQTTPGLHNFLSLSPGILDENSFILLLLLQPCWLLVVLFQTSHDRLFHDHSLGFPSPNSKGSSQKFCPHQWTSGQFILPSSHGL